MNWFNSFLPCQTQEPIDLAQNGTVRAILQRLLDEIGGRKELVSQQLRRFKKGLARAKVVIGQELVLKQIHNERRRYGRIRGKKHKADDGGVTRRASHVYETHHADLAGDAHLKGLAELGIDLTGDGFFRR